MSSKRNFCLTSCSYALLHGAASPLAAFTWAILPAVRASWHYAPGAIQQRFIMVHKHTRPGRRKASTSFYFCPHVKSVKEGQPLLFGLTPFNRNYFLCNSYQLLCVVQLSAVTWAPRDGNYSLCSGWNGGCLFRRSAAGFYLCPELSKGKFCTVATSWYIHAFWRGPFSNSHFLYTCSEFVMQERTPPAPRADGRWLCPQHVMQVGWFSSWKDTTVFLPRELPLKAFLELLLSCKVTNRRNCN